MVGAVLVAMMLASVMVAMRIFNDDDGEDGLVTGPLQLFISSCATTPMKLSARVIDAGKSKQASPRSHSGPNSDDNLHKQI